MPDCPFSVLTRSSTYFRTTAQLVARDLCLRPFPEMSPGARALPPSGGPLLFHCLTRQLDFDDHARTGVVNMQLCALPSTPAERSAALFAAAVTRLSEQCCPARLTQGVQSAGGVACTVSLLLPDVGAATALRIVFSDTAAAPRLASPAFVDRLRDALGCDAASIVVVPLLFGTLLAARCDDSMGMCALGDFSIFDDLEPFEKTEHLSSVPLQLSPERSSEGFCVWRPYPRFGGDVQRLAPGPLPVPSNAAEVDRMLEAIQAAAQFNSRR